MQIRHGLDRMVGHVMVTVGDKDRHAVEVSLHTLSTGIRAVATPEKSTALALAPCLGHEVVIQAETACKGGKACNLHSSKRL